MSRHARYLARTVFTDFSKSSNSFTEMQPHEEAYRELTFKLNKENILQTTKRNRYYEKPWMRRRRIAYEECQEIRKKELQRKFYFVIRQNRREPWRV